MAGADLIAAYPRDWKKRLRRMSSIDWSRSNTQLWEGRAMIGGQMSKARNNIIRTASALKQILGLPLSPQEERLERNASPVIVKAELQEAAV